MKNGNVIRVMLFLAMGVCISFCTATIFAQETEQQFIEMRIYRTESAENQDAVAKYLKTAYLPALKRSGISNIGVFTNSQDSEDKSIFVLTPFPSLDVFSQLNDRLANDNDYQTAAKTYFERPLKEPAFKRIESRLLKSFAGMPRLDAPTKNKNGTSRVFELRLYESHTEDHALRKVAMFNGGEVQLMKDVELGPVFFGETLIGSDVPNLVYMLSAENMEQHKEHWKAFLAHPEWERMKNLAEFKDTVSHIQNWFLESTDFSDY